MLLRWMCVIGDREAQGHTSWMPGDQGRRGGEGSFCFGPVYAVRFCVLLPNSVD